MSQDYSDEWRKALTERDMAVRAIAEFLAKLSAGDAPGVGDAGFTYEVVSYIGPTGQACRRVLPKEFPEFDRLKEVVKQFKPKAIR